MKSEIREICGDWALDIFQYPEPAKPITIFFNSRQNALNVKRILEVDDSIPNAATVCDMQEVVRCKDCKHYNTSSCADGFGWCEYFNNGAIDKHFCSYGERKDKE